MGEIDRIHPILRPILGPRSTDRVQPDSRHRHPHDEPHDEIELANAQSEDAPMPEEPPPQQDHHGLDLSI